VHDICRYVWEQVHPEGRVARVLLSIITHRLSAMHLPLALIDCYVRYESYLVSIKGSRRHLKIHLQGNHLESIRQE
jgi:hypothetical protein